MIRLRRDRVDEVALPPARRRLDRVERGDSLALRDVMSRAVHYLQLGEGEDVVVFSRRELEGGHPHIASGRARAREDLRSRSGVWRVSLVPGGQAHDVLL